MRDGESLVPAPGFILRNSREMLVLEAEQPLRQLNTSVWNGGFSSRRLVVNWQVPSGYMGEEPQEDLRRAMVERGLDPGEATGMMTAALVADVSVFREDLEDLWVVALVTAGTSNAMSAGGPAPPECFGGAGTINTIVLTGAALRDEAMAGAVITATEAKTMALMDLGIRDIYSGWQASGTSTDAVVVVSGSGGEPLRYAGTATALGGLIGRTVRRAVTEAVGRYLKYKEDHPE